MSIFEIVLRDDDPVLVRAAMKHSVLGSAAVMSFMALLAGGCSPSLSQPKASTDLDTATSTTSLTAAEPLPPNRAPLEAWDDAKPAAIADAPPASPPPPVSTWETPAPVQEQQPAVAPAKPAVAPLDPWTSP